MKKTLSLLLSCLLALVCFTGCFFVENITTLGNYFYDADGYEEYSVFSAKASSLTGITKVHVDWISGNVEITEGDAFAVSDTSEGDFFPSYYKVEDGELFVRFAENGTPNSALKSKRLSLTVTSDVTDIKLETVSAEQSVSVTSLFDLSSDTVSGTGNFVVQKLTKGNFKSVSANFTLSTSSFSLAELKFYTVSGNATLNTDTFKKADVSFNSVSGKLNNELEGNAITNEKYDLKCDTVSGNLDVLFITNILL